MAKQVVILAAGLGTRLGRPHPKPLTQLRSGESIMRRAVDSLRTAYGDDVFVTAVVGFKLDLVIEAMPDISFVYNEVYDSTNTSKSLLKALQALPARRRAVAQRRRGLRPAGAAADPGAHRDRAQLRVREHRVGGGGGGEVHPRRRRLHQGAVQAGRRRSRRGRRDQLHRRRGQGHAARAAGRGRRPGLLRARHRGGHRADGLRVEALDISQFHIVEVDFDEDLTRANEFVES